MVTGLKFAVVSAIFLLPFAYPHSALSRIWSLSYQEAVWMCSTGTTRLATSCTGTRWLVLRCRTQPIQSNNTSFQHDRSKRTSPGCAVVGPERLVQRCRLWEL